MGTELLNPSAWPCATLEAPPVDPGDGISRLGCQRLVWKAQLRHIRGRVLDQASQRPIADAQVALGDRRVRTDAAGAYDLPVPEGQIPALSHRLRISHPGYQPRNWTVNLADGQQSYEIPLHK